MNQFDLAAFVKLAQTLHFGKASHLSAMSPSALSRCVKRLEEELGERLFNRDNRRVSLTRAGELFHVYATESLAGLREFRRSLEEEGREVSGELSIFASVTACYSILPRFIPRFRSRHPRVHVHLRTGDESAALAELSSGSVDLAVLARPYQLPSGLAFTSIRRTPLVPVGPAIPCGVRGLLRRGRVDWAEVPLILQERGLARMSVDAWFRAKGARPSIYAQVSGNEAILAMVGLGCGAGVVPRLVLEKSPIRGRLVELSISPPLPAYDVGLAVSERRLKLPAVAALWEEATYTAAAAAQPTRTKAKAAQSAAASGDRRDRRGRPS